MLDTRNLKRAANNPELVARKSHQLYHTKFGKKPYNTEGINIFDEDWDNLIILDACRYDYYAEHTPFDGSLESRTSRGSATYEFVRANFSERDLHDVVYVTANSWFKKLRSEIDSEVHQLIDLQTLDLDDEYYIEELDNIVHASAVTKYAKQAAEEYPNKRLLIHYLRPHHPFIGPYGREKFPHVSSSLTEVLDAVGISDPEPVQKAYRENLDIVLEEVDEVLESLSGKTVITADHGELLGERYSSVPLRDFGHPSGLYREPLVQVPWHTVDDGEDGRREIIPEEPTQDETSDTDMDDVDETLRALGYKV